MEEILYEEGRSAPSLAEAWQRVDQLEKLYWEDGSVAAGTPGSASRCDATVVTAAGPRLEGAETVRTSNQPGRSEKAA